MSHRVMAQVFLSYSHHNRQMVSRIADGLTGEGYSLWWDRNLRAGHDYASDIEAELQDATCVVVVWSAAARNSLWVRAEASAALEQDKLVQVSADKARPPLPFTMLHLLDLSEWSGSRDHPSWREFGDSVGHVVAGGPIAGRAADAKQSPPSLFGPMVAVGAGSLGLIALVGAVVALIANAPERGHALGAITLASFTAACLGLGYMLMRTIAIGLASRKSA